MLSSPFWGKYPLESGTYATHFVDAKAENSKTTVVFDAFLTIAW